MCDKPVKLHVCPLCFMAEDHFHAVCPHCTHKAMRCCHSLTCTNMVNGDIGTLCKTCKTKE